ncbi:MAG: hypothetical protein ACYCWE_18510 [Eubacteriales bacterium]
MLTVKLGITKAKRLLGYDPDYNFKKGLDETINWYILNHGRLV